MVHSGTVHQHISDFSPADRNNGTFTICGNSTSPSWKSCFYQRYGFICRSGAGWMAQQALAETRQLLSLTIDKARSGIISASNLKSEPTDMWHSLVRHWIGTGGFTFCMPKWGDENKKVQAHRKSQGGWGKEWFTCAILHMTSLIHKEVKQPCIPNILYIPKITTWISPREGNRPNKGLRCCINSFKGMSTF